MRRLALILLVVLSGCTTLIVALNLDERFGVSDPARFDRPVAKVADAPDYWGAVRPILDRRCVACHACHDSPCQLNLTSYAGLTRGASAKTVYSAARLIADEPTRLGFDARSNAEWRSKGFFPVLNERENTPAANLEGGVMYHLLAAKQAQAGLSSIPVADKDIDLSLDREELCVPAEGAEHYVKKHPLRGMPFALPPISSGEHKTLSRWLEAGAPYSPLPPLPQATLADVAAWESFLNGNSLKEQLAARYIFEHWYVGQMYFDSAPDQYFEWVRSKTPPGQAIDVVATRRPYDDPGVKRVYYRLRHIEASQPAKKYMPLKLDAARMTQLRGWFMDAAINVQSLPGYDAASASNPFVTFKDLPVDTRYRFMLNDAQFIMQGFMKGPVCRGQVALNVINDHFWVMFLAPDGGPSLLVEKILEENTPNLQLPAAQESTTGLLAWRDYAKLEKRQLATRNVLLRKLGKDGRLKLQHIWDGDGSNPNAALTVFRHFDSASVITGLAGQQPQTMLLLTYPLFERMHYLLLAGFDVYGNVGHQLATRLYMDFLRMEGELNFLALLPIKKRQAVLDHWYRGRKEVQNEYLADAVAYVPIESGLTFKSQKPLPELYAMLRKHSGATPNPAWNGAGAMGLSADEARQLRQLSDIKGQAAASLPEFSLLMIKRPDGTQRLVSLIRNSAHSNIAYMFGEENRRLPKEDTLLALPGVAAAYPNAFFKLNASELGEFVAMAAQLDGAVSHEKLLTRFGVRRSDPGFWAFSDAVHEEWQRFAPREAAILDYSRLENY